MEEMTRPTKAQSNIPRAHRSPQRRTPPAVPGHEPKPSLTDAAVDLIRSKIIDLTLEPGSRIDEPLLSKRFKLGRTPAREAVNRLAVEGLLNISPNRGGIYVRALDFREIGEIVVAQQLAEAVLAQLCRFEDAALARDLQTIQERYLREVEQRDYLRITAINEEFHLRMHQSIGNSLFFQFAQSVHRHVRRLLILIYKMEEMEKNILDDQFDMNLAEHLRIIEAVRDRDRGRLLEILPAHARQTQRRLLRLLSSKSVETISLCLQGLTLAD